MLYFTSDVFYANTVFFFFLLKSKDDMEVLLFVGNLAKNGNLDTNTESKKSETHCFSKKSPNCHRKGEQEERLSTGATGSIQDTTER